MLGGECQGLLSGFGHSHASAHRVYLVWAQEGSELLTVGAFKGEQRGLGRGGEKTGVGRVAQPFRKPKPVFVAFAITPAFDSAYQVFALSECSRNRVLSECMNE